MSHFSGHFDKHLRKQTSKSVHHQTIFVLQQRQNLGRRFGTSKMHLSPSVALATVHSKVVVMLLIQCWLLLPLWDSVIFLCFVMRYFMSILVLQSSWWGRGSWLLCLVCLPGVSWLLCGSSSRCHVDGWLRMGLLPPPREFCRHILSCRKLKAESFKRCLHSVLRGVSL